MSSTRTADCRKFSPNIFNKSKCSHCFRQREEHSAAALECNRASRKVSKCGYLFVAPDWDFSNPYYRTKRWQRRWFVLYDDGELTYSVDEHPETVPQACIDMTKVLEVATAEDVTGHTNSIAITAPDRVTFVKGTCPEESKWWLNILSAFPKSKGRHKRNATFPGGQATTILQTNSDAGVAATVRNRHNSYHKDALTSAQSTGVLIGTIGGSVSGIVGDEKLREVVVATGTAPRNDHDDDDDDDGVETGEDEEEDDDDEELDEEEEGESQAAERSTKSTSKRGNGGQDENNRNAGNEISNRVSPPCLLIEDIRRDEKTIKDIANTITNLSQQQKTRWSTTTAVNNALNSQHLHHAVTLGSEEKASHDETDFHRPHALQTQTNTIVNNLRPKSLPLAANTTPAIVSAIVKKIPPVLMSATAAGANSNANTGDNNNNSSTSNNNNSSSKSSPRLQLQLKQLQQKHQSNQQRQHKQHLQQQQQKQKEQQQQQAHERGDPDGGCNLDDISSNYLAKTVELRVKPTVPVSPADESQLSAKKGWLLKQDNRTGEWTKHWFSLSGAALFYYRDAEERGVLDGVLDVNSVTSVVELNSVGKNHAFQLTTWDKRRLILASHAPTARINWIAVLRHAAGLQKAPAVEPSTPPIVELRASSKGVNVSAELRSEIEQDFMKAQRNQELSSYQSFQDPTSGKSNSIAEKKSKANVGTQLIVTTTSAAPKTCHINVHTPPTPKILGHCSSDEEYRTASEGGRRDSVDWGSSPMSPSPPIPLTMLRSKDRLRYPRIHKRSRSSPPSSRRSTMDSVASDELPIPPLVQSVQEELKIDKELQLRLRLAEQERNALRDEAKERETRMSELLCTLERTEQQLSARIQEMEAVRESLSNQLADAKRDAAEIVERLTDELEENQKKLRDLEDRLARGIDENETLYKRLRELESCSPASFGQLQRGKLKRMDSLSDLTQISDIDPYCLERNALAEEYNELRSRFEKAVNEIRAMKRELKESQNQYDSLEISYAALQQDLERKEIEDRAQVQMMAERIQDLTLKYSGAERQVRTLKQKLSKTERRRSLSLKGKEQLTISKELELKLYELEAKVDKLENSHNDSQPSSSSPRAASGKTSAQKTSRRLSLESSGTVSAADALEFMVRVNKLEKRCESVAGTGTPSSSASTPSHQLAGADTSTAETVSSRNSVVVGNSKLSEHLIERLRCLENVLTSSRDRLEQSLHQLQSLRSSRTRRSVSPITERKDSYRSVERCLVEVVKLLRESCETCVVSGSAHSVPMLLSESSPVRLALVQLETQLRSKLADLLQQRRVLRERNELTKLKDLELLAERVAFESVCFGRLRDSVTRAEYADKFEARQTRAEVAETAHLMTLLKAKLSGKCALKSSGSLDILAGVLARRLLLSSYHKDDSNEKATSEPVDPNMLEELLRQQQEINVISMRYKHNAMESLATGLAAETLSYISANDLVQGAVQEAWRQAQETVNAELVQSEIAHIMMRNAERFEHTTTPAFGYTLTAAERLSFEKFADAVHDVLRREMELAVAQLTHCYEDAMQQMKRGGQWRLHMQPERKSSSEGRQLLAEFADIVAHKALIDARIAVLRGDHVSSSAHSDNYQDTCRKIGITALQHYEQLFEELSSDLQLHNVDDILAEADFEYMYKQHTIDFFNDRQVISEISTFLGQLEDSLIALQCEAASTTSVPRTAISIESLKDVCHKCCDLRQRADQLLQTVQRKLKTPCPHCLQMREKLSSRQQLHETDLKRLEQAHAKEMNVFKQQLEHQRHAMEQLQLEKQAIDGDLQQSEQLMEQRERELQALTQNLQAKEEELRSKQRDQLAILQRIDEQNENLHSLQEESEALTLQCARKDEKYAAMLQERDYLQGELKKEQERNRRLEKRLELVELEHGKQLECLQQAYRDQLLSHCSDFSNVADEESFRQRYQTEIEQLRTLCEKGLSAMESSHRRIITDLEEKHKQEIDRLLHDKETALAEETQATLAALDAMRKAHQSEVTREVARFKQEFLKQFQKGEHASGSTKAKEEELEELRLEILSFSEKYSVKCVENAALEEKLRGLNQKLKQFQQMQQLELRNKQFRAHLAADDPTTDVNFVQGLTVSKEDDANCQDSELNLHAHAQTRTADLPKTNPHADATPAPKEALESCLSEAVYSQEGPGPTILPHRGEPDNVYFDTITYEPCYKQVNLYSFQTGSPLEGLKSTTFGKSLRTQTKTLTNATTTHRASSPASSSTFTLTTTTTTTAKATNTIVKSNLFNRFRIRKMPLKQEQNYDLLNKTIATTTTTRTRTYTNNNHNNNNSNNNSNSNNINESDNDNINIYQQYLQKQQQQQQQQEHLLTTNKTKNKLIATITPTETIRTRTAAATTTTTNQPVEQPKIFSANNSNSNSKISQHKEEQVEDEDEEYEKEENEVECKNLKLINLNHNLLNSNNTNGNIKMVTSKATIAPTAAVKTTTAKATNLLKLAERTAIINLNSFTNIVEKATATATATLATTSTAATRPTTARTEQNQTTILCRNDDVGDDELLQKQQQ